MTTSAQERNNGLIAHYRFNDENHIGKDSSPGGHHAEPSGLGKQPLLVSVKGRQAVRLHGGKHASSYLKLPEELLQGVDDNSGVTIAAWVYMEKGESVWERLFDFGAGPEGPYLFATRQFRGVCFAGTDLAVDPGKAYAIGEWHHVALSVAGTGGGTRSSGGPVLYVNGEAASDGSISQTSSGQYAKLRDWFRRFEDMAKAGGRYYIGASQYSADSDFMGCLSDFRVYGKALSGRDVVEIMCESLTDGEIAELALRHFLPVLPAVASQDIHLPSALMGGAVRIQWKSGNPSALSDEGKVDPSLNEPAHVSLTAVFLTGECTKETVYELTVLPNGVPAYTIEINGERELLDIGPDMYGLFYEDINNAADGGIYAELIQNRSFEAFEYDSYSHVCGEHGTSTGKKNAPLASWFGDTDKVAVMETGGLNEHFGILEKDVNARYIVGSEGMTLVNKGFNDTNGHCAIAVRDGQAYRFTVWAKSETGGSLTIQLQDAEGAAASQKLAIPVEKGSGWRKYGDREEIVLIGSRSLLGQLSITFGGEVAVDMVSLFPENVWGSQEEAASPSARSNYTGNPNYRLRRDLVETLLAMKPRFFRFPGGCISEGSHVWENVYDWKHSVGPIELRKENYNVWGYMMTLGLGYFEYFQLAEDLGALPLPVMACGVLCQARSDYANPAGGALRDYYIRNFTDLIDFAISMDFEGNQWAALRKEMGHAEPFDLRYLGIGNENWGTEFFANFEAFKSAVDAHMEEHYPGHVLHIISTVGAQADDDAYQEGWKFLSGARTGKETVTFTDGHDNIVETVEWYGKQNNYMDTIADEHYYRSNDYLLRNADRYNYYYRAYLEDGKLDERETSKVFVGEYASTDKNTLAGAVAEAAMMTGFERNADVVRLAAYAPLFNKVLTDGTYRWTPDCIWFDDETVWRTPNYYVQQLFAQHAGEKLLGSALHAYRNGKLEERRPRGGVLIGSGNGEIAVRSLRVISNADDAVWLEQDFTKPLDPRWKWLPEAEGGVWDAEEGLIFKAQAAGRNGLYFSAPEWSDYRVEVKAVKRSGTDGFFIGVGLGEPSVERRDVIEYAVGLEGDLTAVKVYKEGVEGYTLGDYSSSRSAGNLRTAIKEPVELGELYTLSANYGGGSGDKLIFGHETSKSAGRTIQCKLEAYHRDLFYSVTRDGEAMYVKLVNPDAADKPVRIAADHFGSGLSEKGEAIVLTGDKELAHLPNVNQKGNERVQPKRFALAADQKGIGLTLPAYSVTVVVWPFK